MTKPPSKRPVTIKLDYDLWKLLLKRKVETGVNLTYMVREALKQYLGEV
jgi:hypothetical protein